MCSRSPKNVHASCRPNNSLVWVSARVVAKVLPIATAMLTEVGTDASHLFVPRASPGLHGVIRQEVCGEGSARCLKRLRALAIVKTMNLLLARYNSFLA